MFPSKRNTAQWGLYPESLDLLKGPVWLDCSITAGLQRPPPCSTVENRTQESRRVVHTGSRLAARTTVASPPGQGPLHGDKLPPRAVTWGHMLQWQCQGIRERPWWPSSVPSSPGVTWLTCRTQGNMPPGLTQSQFGHTSSFRAVPWQNDQRCRWQFMHEAVCSIIKEGTM